jgi:dTDP-glucose pyrophosphorylase
VNELMLVTAARMPAFRLLGNADYGIDKLFYGYQERAGGIGEALGLAERFVDQAVRRHAATTLERTIRPVGELPASAVWSADRPRPRVRSRAPAPPAYRSLTVTAAVRIVEKLESPPSEYAVTGIYFTTPPCDIVPSPSCRAAGSLEITDGPTVRRTGAMEYDASGLRGMPASRSTRTTRSTFRARQRGE